MKYLNKKTLISVAIVSALGTSLVSATSIITHHEPEHPAPMPNVYDGGNRWLITAYDDSSPSHNALAEQGLCFSPYSVKGTHIRGK